GLWLWGNMGIISGLGNRHLGAASTAGEDTLSKIGADGPECARGIRQLGDIGRLPTALRKEIQRRIIRRLRHADLCVLRGHQALCFRDVGPTLEQVRWQAGVNSGRIRAQLLRSEMEVRSWLTNESGDGVFGLLALLKKKCGLSARGVQQGLFLRYIQSRGDSTLVTRFD